jgi:hypothetical protein
VVRPRTFACPQHPDPLSRCFRRRPGGAFGDDPTDRLLQVVLLRGYLDPAASHEAAAEELHLSRSAYFRRLKQAVERLAEYLASCGS